MRVRLLVIIMCLAYVSIALATGWFQLALAISTVLIAFILLSKE